MRIVDLEMEVKDVDDLDENWLANVSCQHACVQRLALPGSVICSQNIIVHSVTNERTNVNTAGRVAPLERCKKSWSLQTATR